MKGFMVMLLICSVTMSAAALFYMAATPLLAKHYSVKARYYSWLVIIIGLIIPFRPKFGNALVRVNVPDSPAVSVIRLGNGTSVPAAVPAGNAVPSALPNIPWWQIAGVLWLTGMIVCLVYHVIRHLRFLKLVSRWSDNVTDDTQLGVFQSLKTQMGITESIGLQVCESIGSPMMTGFVKPRILLPDADFTTDELRLILKHELVHYKRRDLWYKGLVLAANAIHWFNPAVYLMTQAIDSQCELACDEEVVCGTGADIRQYYCETIIGVIRYQSKRKTALSTFFYKGKKGMKERIFSIMDMKKKKTGRSIMGGVLILTLGLSFTLSAKAETKEPPKIIQEDIKEDLSFSYGFLPDPQVYSQYADFGITISENGKELLYGGQKVRLFVDEYAKDGALFLDEAGTLDLAVNRNADGRITGIEKISEDKAQKYRSVYFSDDIRAAAKVPNAAADNTQNTAGKSKYDQYQAYGIELSSDGNTLYYNGQRVKLFLDILADGSAETYWSDDAGTVSLSVVRDVNGQITSIAKISEEQAQKYLSALEEREKNSLDGLEEKVEAKVKEKFQDN